MNLLWGDARSAKFVTNVGLITSYGPYGHNIMAAEWTHHISYKPGLIAANISPKDATHANIMKTKEFGVNLCADKQNVISSIAGGHTGKEVDKIAALKELGFEFYKAKKINCVMVKYAALNAECKLVKAIKFGDHTMFVGEVVESTATERQPLAYHGGKYWFLEKTIKKPPQDKLDKIRSVIERHRK